MFYAVWPFPVYLMFVYMRIFDRWFFTEDDERKVADLAAAQRQKEAEGRKALEVAGGDAAGAGGA